MKWNKTIGSVCCLLFFLAGCIESYMPNIDQDMKEYLVVDGCITDQEGYQTVKISNVSPLSDPEFLPLSGCQVEIQDEDGRVFIGNESGTGEYRVWMDKEFLKAGAAYRVRIITPSGEEILSAFDRMPECALIDSVYFEREELTSDVTGITVQGLQFYIDLKGTSNDSRYYKWTIDETWEYHTPYPIEGYYDGTVRYFDPPDYSKKVCWNTQNVKNIYTLSTMHLVSNSFERHALHYVDNTTAKLYIGYSALITQFALSEASYQYWEQLRINSEEQGGLYEKQPVPVQGNLENITDQNQKVLGFFGASVADKKRIFVEGIKDMGISYDSICSPYTLDRFGWRQFPRSTYPVYFVFINHSLRIVEDCCVDCTSLGGINVKPGFWKW